MREYIISADDVKAIEEEFNIHLSFEKDDELIRCKDCKHYTKFPFGSFCMKSLEIAETTDYCSKAEPKETA